MSSWWFHFVFVNLWLDTLVLNSYAERKYNSLSKLKNFASFFKLQLWNYAYCKHCHVFVLIKIPTYFSTLTQWASVNWRKFFTAAISNPMPDFVPAQDIASRWSSWKVAYKLAKCLVIAANYCKENLLFFELCILNS